MEIDDKTIKKFMKTAEEVKGVLFEVKDILKEILQELNNLSFV